MPCDQNLPGEPHEKQPGVTRVGQTQIRVGPNIEDIVIGAAGPDGFTGAVGMGEVRHNEGLRKIDGVGLGIHVAARY